MQNDTRSPNDSIRETSFWKGLTRWFLFALCIVPFLSGCERFGLSRYKSLPAPLAESFPYEIVEARSGWIWGGDNFEINVNGSIHNIVLEGVDSPKPGQEFFENARKYTVRAIRPNKIRAVVVGHDEMMREIAQVYVEEKNLNLEMVKAGMAWWDGNEFENSDEIKLAQSNAKKSKKGLWKNPDAIHPSVFESRRSNDE